MTVNQKTLDGMIRFFKDDSETLEAIVMALETFESYLRRFTSWRLPGC